MNLTERIDRVKRYIQRYPDVDLYQTQLELLEKEQDRQCQPTDN